MKPFTFSGRIRIINPPRGNIAPYLIRQAWEQLEVPCSPFLEIAERKGILQSRQPRHEWNYIIPQVQALSILAEHKPDAAKWWITNGYPKGEDYFFRIHQEDAVVLEDSVHPIEMVNFITGLGGHVE